MENKHLVTTTLTYWWRRAVYLFWYGMSAIILGEPETDVLLKAELKANGAKTRMLKRKVARHEAAGGTAEETSDLQVDLREATQQMKAVRDTGPRKMAS